MMIVGRGGQKGKVKWENDWGTGSEKQEEKCVKYSCGSLGKMGEARKPRRPAHSDQVLMGA